MKINRIKPHLQTLNEGLQFGQKEISEILENADDIYVGWEFEFHVYEEEDEEAEEVSFEDVKSSMLTNIYRNMFGFFNENENREIYKRIRYLHEFTFQYPIVDFLNDLKETSSDEEIEEVYNHYNLDRKGRNYIINSIKYLIQFDLFYKILRKNNEEFYGMLLSDSLFDTVFAILPLVKDLEDNLKDVSFKDFERDQEKIDQLKKFFDHLNHLIQTEEVHSIFKEFIGSLDSVVEFRQFMESFVQESDRFMVAVQRAFQSENNIVEREKKFDFDAMKAIVESELQFFSLMEYVEGVVPDSSVEQGLEVVFAPYPIDEAMDILYQMCELIQKVGYTSESTGVHVNVSLKNSPKEFNILNLNMGKLLLLLDEQYLRKFFDVRNMSRNIVFESLRHNVDLDELAKQYNTLGIRKVEQEVSRALKSGHGKNYQINLEHFRQSERGRIEWRAPGGTDYEYHADEIYWNSFRFVHALMIAFDDDFMEREYFKELSKLINDYSERVKEKSFVELTRKTIDNDLTILQTTFDLFETFFNILDYTKDVDEIYRFIDNNEGLFLFNDFMETNPKTQELINAVNNSYSDEEEIKDIIMDLMEDDFLLAFIMKQLDIIENRIERLKQRKR